MRIHNTVSKIRWARPNDHSPWQVPYYSYPWVSQQFEIAHETAGRVIIGTCSSNQWATNRCVWNKNHSHWHISHTRQWAKWLNLTGRGNCVWHVLHFNEYHVIPGPTFHLNHQMLFDRTYMWFLGWWKSTYIPTKKN